MTKTNFSVFLRPFHKRLITTGLFVWLLAGYFGGMAFAATPVVLMPVPKPQFFDNSGRPLAFGCIFTYENGSSTPLATYTDYTGATQNSNPVDLTSGGFTASGSDGIWLQAGLAYRLVVKAAGGSHCATGSTEYTVDGIGGGTTTLTTNVTYSTTPVFNIQAQNQLFILTLTGDASAQPVTAVGIIPPAWITFEIIQDAVGGHSFSWPSNSADGAAIGAAAGQVTIQNFVWDGTTMRAQGPAIAEQVPALSRDLGNFPGDINVVSNGNFGGPVTAQYFQSLCANLASLGTIRLCKTDNILWRNNGNSANQGIGQETGTDFGTWSFASGLELTGAAPDIYMGGRTASFPFLKRNATAINFRLGDDSADAPITASTLGLSDIFTSTSTTYTGVGKEVSTPGSPPSAGNDQLYPKAGKGWCGQDSASVEYCMTSAPSPIYSTSGTQATTFHWVYGSGTTDGGGSFTVTLTGAAIFTSSATYYCAGTKVASSSGIVYWTYTSGSAFTVNAGGTQEVRFVCVGN